jgi:pyruvate,orthophosphate dikinase
MFFNAGPHPRHPRDDLSDTVEERKKALAKLLPMQQGDFEGIYEAIKGRARHHPLPGSASARVPAQGGGRHRSPWPRIWARPWQTSRPSCRSLHEFNPMMGHRGCRLCVTYPEIAEMQTTAVIKAALAVSRIPVDIVPEIMIPLVGEVKELAS